MKINRCLPVAFLCLLIGTLTACVTVPTSANPLPTLAPIVPTSPAVDLPPTSAPLPTPLALNTQAVQQPTALASSTATIAPTKSATLSPITPAATLPLASTTAVVCKYEWFFSNSGSFCPIHEPLSSYAVVQPFEHGQMIWVEETDIFYIMFNAGAYPGDSRQVYLTFKDIQLRPGASVDHRVGEPVPAGLHEPVSGFGLLWRNEIEGVNLADLHAQLGWATKPEEGFQTQYQCTQTTTYSWQSCYLLSPQNTVFSLAWTAWVGQVWGEFNP